MLRQVLIAAYILYTYTSKQLLKSKSKRTFEFNEPLLKILYESNHLISYNEK